MEQTTATEERTTGAQWTGTPSGTALDRRDEPGALDAPLNVITDSEFKTAWRIAKTLAASGFFKDAQQAERAFAKILLGRDLGLSPTEAMSEINIIEGKAEASANFHALRVKRTPGYDYKVRELSAEKAVIEFFGPDDDGKPTSSLGVSEFSIEDAQRAELDKRARGKNAAADAKGNYDRYPRNMLFARAMSNGVTWYCPEVMGSIRVYSAGELADGLGEAETATTDTELVEFVHSLDDVPDELKRELFEALAEANRLMPGKWSVAQAQMVFTGRTEAEIRDRLAEIEVENVAGRKRAEEAAEKSEEPITDAVVVEDDAPGKDEEPPPVEGLDVAEEVPASELVKGDVIAIDDARGAILATEEADGGRRRILEVEGMGSLDTPAESTYQRVKRAPEPPEPEADPEAAREEQAWADEREARERRDDAE